MSKNDITGDKLQTKPATTTYRDNYDKIFKKGEQHEVQPEGARHELAVAAVPSVGSCH